MLLLKGKILRREVIRSTISQYRGKQTFSLVCHFLLMNKKPTLPLHIELDSKLLVLELFSLSLKIKYPRETYLLCLIVEVWAGETGFL